MPPDQSATSRLLTRQQIKMAVSIDETHDASLDMLEARLQRINYALNGDGEIEDASARTTQTSTAAHRLRNLERQMQLIATRSPAAGEVLKLQAQHPSIFEQAIGAEQTNTNTLPLAPQAALILAHAQLYSRVSGQLQSLQETSVPDPTSASKLRELQPRIEKAAARQQQQANELAELRSRSAAAVERWYESGVLGMAERWAEWEERMRDVEIVVRRLEAMKKREEELV
jgi:DNA repair ATPase RecN